MAVKDQDGYTIFRNKEDSCYPCYRRRYLVDGCNIEGDPEKGLWTLDELDTCRTKKEVLKTVRRYKDKYDKIEVWEERIEECFDKYGFPIFGDKISQTLHTYIKGRFVNKVRLL